MCCYCDEMGDAFEYAPWIYAKRRVIANEYLHQFICVFLSLIYGVLSLHLVKKGGLSWLATVVWLIHV